MSSFANEVQDILLFGGREAWCCKKGDPVFVTADNTKLRLGGDGAREINLPMFLALLYFHFHVKSLFQCDLSLSSSSMISFFVRQLTSKMITYIHTYIQTSSETAQPADVFYKNSKAVTRNGDAIMEIGLR